MRKLSPWEELVVDAVGNTIDFWHFKRNHGRVWAVLYLRNQPLTQLELQKVLGLSKGAASMVTGELELWGVLHRMRNPNDATWRYAAEIDLVAMVRRVIERRESAFVARVLADLDDAVAEARRDASVPRDVLDRLVRMRTLASLVDRALAAFVKTARLDASAIGAVLMPKR